MQYWVSREEECIWKEMKGYEYYQKTLYQISKELINILCIGWNVATNRILYNSEVYLYNFFYKVC